jgi:divalent metal cation (Fe/Co/Zn/Cd) transporter
MNKEELESKKEFKLIFENLALQLSFWTNVFLFFFKLSGAIFTLSLSVISSAIDSFLDLFSGLILYISNRLRKKKSKLDFYHFPVNKKN